MPETIASLLSLMFLIIITYYIIDKISKYNDKIKLERYKRNKEAHQEVKNDKKVNPNKVDSNANKTKTNANKVKTNVNKTKTNVNKTKINTNKNRENIAFSLPSQQKTNATTQKEDLLNEKGYYGESLLIGELNKIDCYKKIYRNMYIPKGNNFTTEIDVIMVTGYGIYVFESKNFNGYIFGDELDKDWTQVFNKKNKFKFYNPILQNKGHILALSDYLKVYVPNMYKSYIVFGKECVLSDITFTSSNTKVIKIDKLKETIENDFSHSNKSLLTEKQISLIDSKLKNLGLADKSTKENHIKNTIGFKIK